jgi:RNA polymerase-interacting CarD/CdnL/TRCF family regulator
VHLEIGGQVFHPIHGVGKVVAIRSLAFDGKRPRLYYEVALDKTTIWVLIEPQGIGRLRPITPKSELARYRAVLKGRPTSLSDNFRARQSDLDVRLKLGTFQAICEIVRDLSARRVRKPLTDYELDLLKKAREFLFQEWAVINRVTSSEAAQSVEALLSEGRKNLEPSL